MKKPSKRPHWIEGLDKEAINEAMEEALIDAFGESEQHACLLPAIQDELNFPFNAQVVGERVNIVDLKWPENDEFGLDLVVERSG